MFEVLCRCTGTLGTSATLFVICVTLACAECLLLQLASHGDGALWQIAIKMEGESAFLPQRSKPKQAYCLMYSVAAHACMHPYGLSDADVDQHVRSHDGVTLVMNPCVHSVHFVQDVGHNPTSYGHPTVLVMSHGTLPLQACR